MESRYKYLNKLDKNDNGTYIAIWLKRDFRFEHNWIFIKAIKLANELQVPIVVFVYLPSPLILKNNKINKFSMFYPSVRHTSFLFNTLILLESSLFKHGISLQYRTGETPSIAFKNDFKDMVIMLTDFKSTTSAILCDEDVSKEIRCSVIQIDTHNIIPTWIASTKPEYMAKTFRSKVQKIQDNYLIHFPKYNQYQQEYNEPNDKFKIKNINFGEVIKDDIRNINLQSGHKYAMRLFHNYVKKYLHLYNERNDPNVPQALSGLSVFINYGVISTQYIVLYLNNIKENTDSSHLKTCIDSFIDEVWIRRELAENFCYYKKNYKSIDSAWNWSLKLISKEPEKKQMYSIKKLENAQTNDPIWNAAQNQMIIFGKMHGYMRMYWAKRISDWSSDRQVAMNIANYLNDKYQMDGSDPNGYTGVAWSIIGVHDRIFYGKFRQLTQNSFKSKKIKIENYVNLYK